MPLTPGPSPAIGRGGGGGSISVGQEFSLPTTAPSAGGWAADVEAGEGEGLAAAAGLEGLELVEGLDVEAVEVGLVAGDVGDGVEVGDEAGADGHIDALGRN